MHSHAKSAGIGCGCHRGRPAEYTAAEWNKKRAVEWNRARYSGWSREAFEEYLDAQEGCCAICGDPMTRPYADHDHETGQPRGLLCGRCNTGIGYLNDDRDRLLLAVEYLDSYQ